MAILSDGPELRLEDLPERFCGLNSIDSGSAKLTEPDIPEEGIDLRSVIEDLENRLIEKALEKSGGVKNRAAQLLGLNRTTLVEKLKKKNLERAREVGMVINLSKTLQEALIIKLERFEKFKKWEKKERG